MPTRDSIPFALHRVSLLCGRSIWWSFVLAVLLMSACTRPIKRAGNPANITGTTNIDAPSRTDVRGGAGERLGTVHVIGMGRRFVLIETPASQPTSTLKDGQTLVCRSADTTTATLHVSHERRPPFVVADVSSGEPHLGDAVFIGPASDPAAAPAAAGATASPTSDSPPPASTPEFRANPALPPAR